MAIELWLPKGFALADGSNIRSLLFSGDDWQIYDTQGADNILVVRPELAQKWVYTGFLEESLLGDITFGLNSYRSLNSPKEYALEPVEGGKSPFSKVDALAFSLALHASRELTGEASFHDAIYVEQYSRLLPTWTLTLHVEDEVVLGTWLSGGVVISSDSFRRLCALAGWMSTSDLADVVQAAGLHVPDGTGYLIKKKPRHQESTEEKSAKKAAVDDQPEQKQQSRDKTSKKMFTLPGRPQLEEFFNEHVIDIIFNAERYQALGIEFPSAIVLQGPPGCGKTFAVERLVEFIDWPSYSIDSNSVGSPYIHETSKKISQVFDQAIDNAPSVLIIDEMESFLSERAAAGSANLHHVEEVAEFLRRIPEAIKSKVLIIAMTNMIEMIDPAILRRGRFDHIIEVGMPSRNEVASLLDALMDKLPKADDINLETLLDALTSRPLSDAAFVVRESARLSAKVGKTMIDQESIIAALINLPGKKEKKSRNIGFL